MRKMMMTLFLVAGATVTQAQNNFLHDRDQSMVSGTQVERVGNGGGQTPAEHK